MAVYEHGYSAYDGPLNPAWNRFLVLARYGFGNVFRSRLFIAYYVSCFLWPLVCTVAVYARYNPSVMELFSTTPEGFLAINEQAFRYFLDWQTFLAFMLILFQGPALVSPDLRNNALPLFLSRPLNKTDYVLGKFLVLATLTSTVTWIPGLFLFLLVGYLQGGRWILDHLPIATGVFFGSWIVIGVLSLYALALSAWVKSKPWAAIAFLGSISVMSSIGGLFVLVFGNWGGQMLILINVVNRIWDQFFGMRPGSGILFDTPPNLVMPATAAWLSLSIFAGFSVLALYRRIRAFEVVS